MLIWWESRSTMLFNRLYNFPWSTNTVLVFYPERVALALACMHTTWAVRGYNVLFVQILLWGCKHTDSDNRSTSTMSWRHSFWAVLIFEAQTERQTLEVAFASWPGLLPTACNTFYFSTTLFPVLSTCTRTLKQQSGQHIDLFTRQHTKLRLFLKRRVPIEQHEMFFRWKWEWLLDHKEILSNHH